MLLMVLLPATNAPSPPINVEKKGHAEPARLATPSASAIGISLYPAAPSLELMNTCTIGTVKTSAVHAGNRVFRELWKAVLYSDIFNPCNRMVIRETMTNIVPGDQNGWKEAPISLPKISDHDQVIKGLSALKKGSRLSIGNRVNTSKPATKKYGDQARIRLMESEFAFMLA